MFKSMVKLLNIVFISKKGQEKHVLLTNVFFFFWKLFYITSGQSSLQNTNTILISFCIFHHMSLCGFCIYNRLYLSINIQESIFY